MAASPRVYPSRDRKSTRLNSSHMSISYAVFCLKKKKMRARDVGYRRREEHVEALARGARRDDHRERSYQMRDLMCPFDFNIFFFFTRTESTCIYTFSLHVALPI